jgi:hypothetical protein
MSDTTYTYRREGSGRVIVRDVPNRRAALALIGYSITDNGHGTRAMASAFLATVEDGRRATFGPYTFTVGRQARSHGNGVQQGGVNARLTP